MQVKYTSTQAYATVIGCAATAQRMCFMNAYFNLQRCDASGCESLSVKTHTVLKYSNINKITQQRDSTQTLQSCSCCMQEVKVYSTAELYKLLQSSATTSKKPVLQPSLNH
eukprot:14690-Heterococcus_DN1.PRE.2